MKYFRYELKFQRENINITATRKSISIFQLFFSKKPDGSLIKYRSTAATALCDSSDCHCLESRPYNGVVSLLKSFSTMQRCIFHLEEQSLVFFPTTNSGHRRPFEIGPKTTFGLPLFLLQSRKLKNLTYCTNDENTYFIHRSNSKI